MAPRPPWPPSPRRSGRQTTHPLGTAVPGGGLVDVTPLFGDVWGWHGRLRELGAKRGRACAGERREAKPGGGVGWRAGGAGGMPSHPNDTTAIDLLNAVATETGRRY